MTSDHDNQSILQHLYPVGALVQFNIAYRYRTTSDGPYQVLSQLPLRDGELQYRVKSTTESHERVVNQTEIAARVEAAQ